MNVHRHSLGDKTERQTAIGMGGGGFVQLHRLLLVAQSVALAAAAETGHAVTRHLLSRAGGGERTRGQSSCMTGARVWLRV